MDLDFSDALNQARLAGSVPRAAQEPDGASKSGPSEKTRAPRAIRACDNCRKRKSKCSGGDTDQPCKECLSTGKTCTFEPIRRRPPKNYVESLEWRIESMEKLMRKIGVNGGEPMQELLAMLEDEDVDDEEKTASIERTTEVLAQGKDSGMQGQKYGLATEEDTPFEYQNFDSVRYIGRSSGPTLAMNILRLAKSTKDPFERTPSLVDQLVDLDRRRVTEDKSALPPPDLAAALINAYFDHFNALTPLLHRPSFERALQSGLLETDVSFRCLVLMIFAIGSRFVKDPRIFNPPSPTADEEASLQARGFYFFQASMASISSILIPASLFDLQWSVLATVWLLGTTTPITVWSVIGFSVRRGIDVGAHVKQRNRWTASPLEDQLRKRAFHSLVALDRHVSATIGRPMALQDHEWDLEPPLDISDDDLDNWNLRGPLSTPPKSSPTPTPLAAMLCQFRLQHIMGRTLTALYAVRSDVDNVKSIQEIVTELDSALNQWQGEVPDHLRWSSSMRDSPWLAASAQLNTQFYLCQSLVHRDFLTPTRSKMHALPSFAICSNAARSIAHIIDVLREKGQLEDGFWYLPLAAGAAGIILLTIIFAQPLTVNIKDTSALGDVEKCLACLTILRKNTAMGTRCHVGLQQLLRELYRGRQPAAQPIPSQVSSTSAAQSMASFPPSPTEFVNAAISSSFPSLPITTFPTPVFDAVTGPGGAEGGLTTPGGNAITTNWDFLPTMEGTDWATLLGGGFNLPSSPGGPFGTTDYR